MSTPLATINSKRHLIMLIFINCFVYIFRKGKYQSIATNHRDEVVGYFVKIDPALGDLVVKSKPKETADGSSITNGASFTKRKTDEPTESSPKKKANVGTNGSMTLSQREKRAMELLASYLEDRGGRSSVHLPRHWCLIHHFVTLKELSSICSSFCLFSYFRRAKTK